MSFPELNREIRGHDFYPGNLDEIPPLYATEHIPLADKVTYLHYFVRGGEGSWYVFEVDRDRDLACFAFGWADLGFGELGLFDLVALESVLIERPGIPPLIAERDLDWTPRPWSEVER